MPFAFGIDENGNYGYIKEGADTVTPFKSYVLVLKNFTISHNQTSYTIDVSSYNNGMDITKATIYPLYKNTAYSFNNGRQTSFSYTITVTEDWKIKYTSNGYNDSVSVAFNFLGFVLLWE